MSPRTLVDAEYLQASRQSIYQFHHSRSTSRRDQQGSRLAGACNARTL